jgi:hypothetical protein
MGDNASPSLELAVPKPTAPKKKSAAKKVETNFGDWVKYGPDKFEKSEWSVVGWLAPMVTESLTQHTTYFIKISDIVQLPVAEMKGESLTSVWSIMLQQRGKDKKSARVSMFDAIVVAMAPKELNVVLSISGYGDRPEPQ